MRPGRDALATVQLRRYGDAQQSASMVCVCTVESLTLAEFVRRAQSNAARSLLAQHYTASVASDDTGNTRHSHRRVLICSCSFTTFLQLHSPRY